MPEIWNDVYTSTPKRAPVKLWANYTLFVKKITLFFGYNDCTMNTVYAVCLVAVLIHVIALPSFFWSLRRRQFRESDEEAYRAVQDEAAFAPRAKRAPQEVTRLLPVTRVRLILLFGFLITLFILILASLIFVTVAAGHAPVAPGSD